MIKTQEKDGLFKLVIICNVCCKSIHKRGYVLRGKESIEGNPVDEPIFVHRECFAEHLAPTETDENDSYSGIELCVYLGRLIHNAQVPLQQVTEQWMETEIEAGSKRATNTRLPQVDEGWPQVDEGWWYAAG